MPRDLTTLPKAHLEDSVGLATITELADIARTSDRSSGAPGSLEGDILTGIDAWLAS